MTPCTYLVQELRQASDRAAASGVMDDGALVQSWVAGLVARLTASVHTLVATYFQLQRKRL